MLASRRYRLLELCVELDGAVRADGYHALPRFDPGLFHQHRVVPRGKAHGGRRVPDKLAVNREVGPIGGGPDTDSREGRPQSRAGGHPGASRDAIDRTQVLASPTGNDDVWTTTIKAPVERVA